VEYRPEREEVADLVIDHLGATVPEQQAAVVVAAVQVEPRYRQDYRIDAVIVEHTPVAGAVEEAVLRNTELVVAVQATECAEAPG
jgi:2',3'-cyclic-nucleotide 2'-phosphodiesterase (5'-nucleotidase family)